MRPPCFCNLCNSEILHFAEAFSEVPYENGYTFTSRFPSVTGTGIKLRINCEREKSGRSRGAHGMSKPLDLLLTTHAAGPSLTWQDEQHGSRVGCRVGRERLGIGTDSKIAVRIGIICADQIRGWGLTDGWLGYSIQVRPP